MRAPLCSAAVASLALLCGGCGPQIDIKQTVHVVDISGGYHDAGVDEQGRNKIVPSVTFRLTTTNTALHSLALNIAFKKQPLPGTPPPPGQPSGTLEDWDEVYVQNVDFNGNSTAPVTARLKAGYTGDSPMTRAEILTNRLFQDVRVDIFAKHFSSQWVEIAEYPLPRRLLTQ